MRTLIFFLLFATFANAQTIEMLGDTSISFGLDQASRTYTYDMPPKNYWGQSHSLSVEDKEVFRLYPSADQVQKQKWYDFSTYHPKGRGKQWVWGAFAVAGILHGSREAYHAQPDVFERRFNASPTSFFGSQQWKRQYYDNNPELPHKPNAWNGLRDYWHFSGATTKYILIGGAFTIGASKQPVKYRIIDTLIGFAGFSASASLTYTLLR